MHSSKMEEKKEKEKKKATPQTTGRIYIKARGVQVHARTRWRCPRRHMSADPLAQLYLPRGQYVDCVRVADYCTVTVKETNVFHRQASIRARGLPANTARWQMAAVAAAHPAAVDWGRRKGSGKRQEEERERRKKYGEKVRGAADAEEKMMNKG